MIRRKFLATVAGVPFLPFAPRVAAVLPVVAAPFPFYAALSKKHVAALVELDRELLETSVLPVNREELYRNLAEAINEHDAILISPSSRQAQVVLR